MSEAIRISTDEPQGTSAMQTIVIATSYHHNSDRPGAKRIYRLPAGTDPYLFALVTELADSFAMDPELLDHARLEDALARARTSDSGMVPLEPCPGYEGNQFSIWFHPGQLSSGRANFGIGPGDGQDKFQNLWIDVYPYQEDPDTRQRLETLNRQQLAALLLRVQAEQGYLPWLDD